MSAASSQMRLTGQSTSSGPGLVEWKSQLYDCRPVQLALAVVQHGDVRATPTVTRVDVTGLSGTLELTYPDFLPAPTVAHASAYAEDGHRSRTVSILIERPANTPSDPPEPIPPVTAPAGGPVTCTVRMRTVEDPAGDVLTYGVGKPPTQVRRMTRALSGIDLVRAAVQIDGRTSAPRSPSLARLRTQTSGSRSPSRHD